MNPALLTSGRSKRSRYIESALDSVGAPVPTSEGLIEKSVGTHTIITCCAVLPKYSTKAHDCMNFKQLLY
jgi:hypothetical protein